MEPKEIIITPKVVEGLRRIYCSSRQDFINAFGEEDGCHLWDKFFHEYRKNVFEFLCYLDLNNLRLANKLREPKVEL